MSKANDAIIALRNHLEISPASVTELAMDVLEEALNYEIDIVDATNPAITILGACTVTTAGAMMRSESLSRREFPALAQDFKDLFPHMSAQDHLDRFAKPSEDTMIVLGFSAREIRNAAVPDTNSGMKKLTIPKDSNFEVNGIDFYLGYPIDIYVMSDGQVFARWDDSIPNPIRTLTTNHVFSKLIYTGTEEVIILNVPMMQVKAETSISPISISSGYKVSAGFSDYFYGARVYSTIDNVTWTELETTFDEQVYDPTKATVILSVEDNLVTARLPEIYFTSNLIGNRIRLDLFTTKGQIVVNLADFEAGTWKGQFIDFGQSSGTYIDPVLKLTYRTVESQATTTGGSNGVTFSEMRERVIYGRHDKDQAISFPELKQELKKQNMGIERQYDLLSNRTFVATKKLDVVVSDGLNTGTGTAAVNINIDLSREDVNNHIVAFDGLSCIKPNALYKKSLGDHKLLSDQETISFENLNSFEKAEFLNESEYFYSPFHYVIDETNPIKSLRAYYLASPTVDNINTIAQNANLGYTVGTTSTEIVYDAVLQEYTVTFVAATPNIGSDVTAVLNFTDVVTGAKWDILGKRTIISSQETQYEFTFTNRLDLDANNTFGVLGMTGTETPRFDLENFMLDLVYVNTTINTATSLDTVLAKNALTGNYTAIVHERIDFNFGTHLSGLYTNIRKTLVPPTYKKWPYDVPLLYDRTEYEEGVDGRVIVRENDGSMSFKTKYEQGDPVMLSGEPVMQYTKGSLMFDDNGMAIEETPSGTAYVCRLCLIDASYRYATTDTIVEYNKSIPKSIISVLEGPIERIRNGLIEETKLYFEPVSDKVDALAILEAGREAYINTSLAFDVRIRLTDAAYETPSVRDKIKAGLIDIILEELENREFYLSRLYDRVADLSPDNIKAIEIDTPIPGASMATLKEDNASFTLASKTLVLANGNIDIVDDVDVEWTT